MHWKRGTGILVILLLGPIAPFALWSLKGMAIYQYRSQQFADQLFAYPLPTNTTVLRKKSATGLLVGNGNHCDYVADLHIKSALSQQEIEQHYLALRLKPARENGEEPYVLVSAEGEGSYLIRAVDAPNPPVMDIRCH